MLSKHLFFRDWGKHIILLFNAAAISVHPKPIVEGGGGLWRGWMEIGVVTDDFPHYWA